ncbi:hypothetical protein [Rhizobium tubonense]|uniref:Uncharacterized protein n=1 Tax=Rhizobium tubonense TaxID=484088 RepID=A0A2W4ELH2_9HYPH|nr:hypothetical protein [Rhizobium tubonense]PZM12213.1 hypothetical protein CPY51_19180 [Rhizobium tubonense]
MPPLPEPLPDVPLPELEPLPLVPPLELVPADALPLPREVPLAPALRLPRDPASLLVLFGSAILAVGWHNAASIEPTGAFTQSTAD